MDSFRQLCPVKSYSNRSLLLHHTVYYESCVARWCLERLTYLDAKIRISILPRGNRIVIVERMWLRYCSSSLTTKSRKFSIIRTSRAFWLVSRVHRWIGFYTWKLHYIVSFCVAALKITKATTTVFDRLFGVGVVVVFCGVCNVALESW